MSPQEAKDLDQEIEAKKSEAHAAWKEYVQAANNADESRYSLWRTRELLFKQLKEGRPVDLSALAMAEGLAEVQSGMDERVQQLGLKCDAIGRELGALQLKKGLSRARPGYQHR